MENKKDKRFFIIFGLVVIFASLVFAAVYFVNTSDREFVPRDKDSFKSQQDYLDYLEEYKQAQSKDTYGGDTPEETLQLFIDALKAGDTTLASKYFVLDKQKEMEKDLEIGKRNGVLELLIGDLEKENKRICYDYREACEFTTFDENNVAEFSFVLSLDSRSKIWKIESL